MIFIERHKAHIVRLEQVHVPLVPYLDIVSYGEDSCWYLAHRKLCGTDCDRNPLYASI
jgi:hypothetical protein